MSEYLLILVIFLLIYLFLVFPGFGRKRQCLELARYRYAHRGLWDRKMRIPENSMSAFRRALAFGCGIELDLHLTKDGKIVVFHDGALRRMCGADGTVEESSCEDLQKLRLDGTDERIPLFSDVLKEIDGKVPLLIELKLSGTDISICPAVAELLKDYRGPYLIQSFNPFGIRWFRRHHGETAVGLLSTKYPRKESLDPLLCFLSANLLFGPICRPDFISYNHRTDHVPSLWLLRKIFRTPAFAWVVRNEKEYEKCAGKYDGIIFEGFLPEKEKGTGTKQPV